MPYSFTKIEKEKTTVIAVVFSFLILLYFVAAWSIYAAVKYYIVFDMSSRQRAMRVATVTREEVFIILGIALVAGVAHWLTTIHNLIPKMIGRLGAEQLNPEDTYHQMFQNIIEEVSVATGGKNIIGAVVPSMSMNAFALSDFSGRAVIGVTEGLLARLSRAQVEAVVGHEAAHVVSGDCLVSTVTTSLFSLYNGLLNGVKKMMSGRTRYRSRGGGPLILLLIVFFLLSITRFMGNLMRMFVSRQREVRADAVAVRLTRDPLSLAEALYTIAHRWRGAGIAGEELESIFIMNPRFDRRDEQSSWFSNLFSTHPPVKKRLAILLDMAHADTQALEDDFKKRAGRPRQLAPEPVAGQHASTPAAQEKQWLIHQDGQWLGPFPLQQLVTLEWLRPDTWVKKMGGAHVTRAFEDSDVDTVLRKGSAAAAGALACPKCDIPLNQEHYEGLPVLRCPRCFGILIADKDIPRIVAREDYCFSERVQALAQRIKKQQEKMGFQKIDLKAVPLLRCPRCQHQKAKMVRMFYSSAYHIEIDKCIFCGSDWFDKDELEVLQCLIEESVKKTQQG